MAALLWLRQDLRLADQPALVAAAAEGAVVPVYVLDDETPGDRRMGGASRWWLHHSVAALAEALEARGSRLILRRGRSAQVLAQLAGELGTRRVHAIRHYEPWWKAAEVKVGAGLDLQLHDGNFLAPPDQVRTGSGGRYRIFTPWWRALKEQMPPHKPLGVPEAIPAPARWPASDALDAWGLQPTRPDWAEGFSAWTPGEAGAWTALRAFLPAIGRYEHDRNYPSVQGSSRLSPHLHFGEISPASVWYQCAGQARADAEPYLREVGWRDFANNVIDMFPDYGDRNGREAFDRFPWRDDDAGFVAWTRGRTGYPIVDAGMRELWATGWMHNRVRMAVASFLIKHLLLPWQGGERWFWDTLVDADEAQNAQNWQWVAGSGADAAPYFRIFNPISQGRKFDPDGAYVRTWVPELARLPNDLIHAPFEASPLELAAAGVVLGKTYPHPLVEHGAARDRALAAFETIKKSAAP